ncbi:hypothetical protein PHJA_001037800 [Phtheirospermum japonicum]|uniref:Uncharacterized protein n=1 Tax=Phtheirospermum japonicum TaxID=374723 RepID=A0A830C3T4_9LAMI|nr:hypothetical protein PHJA_001037800 [Phtheirospermum japonicum]
MSLPRLRQLSATPLPHRLLPTSRFSNPGLLFLSFDVNSAAASTSFTAAPQFPSTIGGGGGSAGFEDEPSLLKELGINIKQNLPKNPLDRQPFPNQLSPS